MTSSAKFAVPFRIALRTSVLLNGALLVMYLGGFYWLWLFDLPLFVKVVVAAGMLAGLVLHLRRHLFRSCRRAVAHLVWKEGEEWLLETCKGEVVMAKLLNTSFVSPWLILLNFKPSTGGWTWPVLIMPDNVDSTSFRRLCAKLRMSGKGAVSS